MNYERNTKYFSQKNKVFPIILSAALIGIGFIMVVFLANTRGIPSRWMMMIGLPILAVGVVIAVVYSASKIKDSEVDDCTHELDENFLIDFKAKYMPTDSRRLRYDIAHGIKEQKFEPVTFGTYSFDGDGIMTKRGSDGKSRSSVYSLSAFMLKPHSLCLAERHVSLTSCEPVCDDRFAECEYVSLGSASLTDPPTGIYVGTTKYKHLTITSVSGETVIEFPILADADADEYVSEIETRIIRSKAKADGE